MTAPDFGDRDRDRIPVIRADASSSALARPGPAQLGPLAAISPRHPKRSSTGWLGLSSCTGKMIRWQNLIIRCSLRSTAMPGRPGAAGNDAPQVHSSRCTGTQ